MDKFEKIKASAVGLEATMKSKINEATVTLDQVRKLAFLSAQIQISLLVRQGRFADPNYEKTKDDFYQNIKSLLAEMEFSKEQQKTVMREVHRFKIHDLAHLCLCDDSRMPSGLTSDHQKPWLDLRRREIDNLPSPDELEAFLKETNLFESRKQHLINYRAYSAQHS